MVCKVGFCLGAGAESVVKFLVSSTTKTERAKKVAVATGGNCQTHRRLVFVHILRSFFFSKDKPIGASRSQLCCTDEDGN